MHSIAENGDIKFADNSFPDKSAEKEKTGEISDVENAETSYLIADIRDVILFKKVTKTCPPFLLSSVSTLTQIFDQLLQF